MHMLPNHLWSCVTESLQPESLWNGLNLSRLLFCTASNYALREVFCWYSAGYHVCCTVGGYRLVPSVRLSETGSAVCSRRLVEHNHCIVLSYQHNITLTTPTIRSLYCHRYLSSSRCTYVLPYSAISMISHNPLFFDLFVLIPHFRLVNVSESWQKI